MPAMTTENRKEIEMRNTLNQMKIKIQKNKERAEREAKEALERIERENQEIIQMQNHLETVEDYNEKMGEVWSNLQASLREQDVDRIPKNLVITSETQNGKTETLLRIVKEADKGTVTVISCDNKGDQLKQLTERMLSKRINHFILSDLSDKKIKKTIEKFEQAYKDDEQIVIVLLNNYSQCSKLTKFVKGVMKKMEMIERYQVIHDEADLINKIDNVATIIPEEDAAKVHTEWIEHFNTIRLFENLKFLKRVWVSATPENCSLIHEVKAKDVFILPTKPDYRPVSEHIEWSDCPDKLKEEVDRINSANSKEAILYCTSRINTRHNQLSRMFSLNINCPVVSYNGKGVNIYKNGELKEKHQLAIGHVLAKLETNYDGAVIIVGHNLMNRGISFISSRKSEKPLTSSVIFYEGKDAVNAVNIAQRLGRVTGTSRPDLSRRVVYCSDKIFQSYKAYLQNQIEINKALQKEENKERDVLTILTQDDLNLKKINRKLDRKELKIANEKYNVVAKYEDSAYSSDNEDGEEQNKTMERFVKSWIKSSNVTAVAQIFRKIYSSPEHRLPASEVKELSSCLGKASTFVTTMCQPGHSMKWATVFENVHEYIMIRSEAVEFIQTLTQ